MWGDITKVSNYKLVSAIMCNYDFLKWILESGCIDISKIKKTSITISNHIKEIDMKSLRWVLENEKHVIDNSCGLLIEDEPIF